MRTCTIYRTMSSIANSTLYVRSSKSLDLHALMGTKLDVTEGNRNLLFLLLNNPQIMNHSTLGVNLRLQQLEFLMGPARVLPNPFVSKQPKRTMNPRVEPLGGSSAPVHPSFPTTKTVPRTPRLVPRPSIQISSNATIATSNETFAVSRLLLFETTPKSRFHSHTK